MIIAVGSNAKGTEFTIQHLPEAIDDLAFELEHFLSLGPGLIRQRLEPPFEEIQGRVRQCTQALVEGAAIERAERLRSEDCILGVRGERDVQLARPLAQEASRRKIGPDHLLRQSGSISIGQIQQRTIREDRFSRIELAAKDIFEIMAESIQGIAPSVSFI